MYKPTAFSLRRNLNPQPSCWQRTTHVKCRHKATTLNTAILQRSEASKQKTDAILCCPAGSIYMYTEYLRVWKVYKCTNYTQNWQKEKRLMFLSIFTCPKCICHLNNFLEQPISWCLLLLDCILSFQDLIRLYIIRLLSHSCYIYFKTVINSLDKSTWCGKQNKSAVVCTDPKLTDDGPEDTNYDIYLYDRWSRSCRNRFKLHIFAFAILHFYKQMWKMRGGSDWETEEKLQDGEQAVDSHTPLYLTPIGPISY